MEGEIPSESNTTKFRGKALPALNCRGNFCFCGPSFNHPTFSVRMQLNSHIRSILYQTVVSQQSGKSAPAEKAW